MIPADVASRLRLTLPEEPAPAQPVQPAKQLTDVLSDLVPGQRLMAQIQAMLPNGTYRAMIAQREVVLSLPFSAKAGDALELEVVESDGKLTLAFLANRSTAEPGSKTAESVSATLSQTGKLIGNLLGNIDDQGNGSQPTPLNGNKPLLESFPTNAAQLVPVLKDALTKSGMFYEAHQAQWVEGKLPKEALLREPQGKLSSAPQEVSVLESQGRGHADKALAAGENPLPGPTSRVGVDSEAAPGGTRGQPQSTIPADIAPLVRQQLDALATQNYVWHGQIWPGQHMDWEIEEDRNSRQESDEKQDRSWQTRLKLNLPGLGSIDAVMRLGAGGAIDLSLAAGSEESRKKLAAAGDGLRRQFTDAGLTLSSLAVQHDDTSS